MADFTIPCPVLAHIKASVVFPEKFSRRKCKDKCVMSNWQQIGFKVMKFDFYGYTGPKSYIFGFSSFNLSAISSGLVNEIVCLYSLSVPLHVEIFSSLEYLTLHTLVVVASIPVGSIFFPIIALTMVDLPLLVSPVYAKVYIRNWK